MSNDRRYFWCDAPSPLHDVLADQNAKREEAFARLDALAKSVGAKCMAAKGGIVYGFVFADTPKNGDVHWKCMGRTHDGDEYYLPKKNSKAGKELANVVAKERFPDPRDAIAHASGLHIMQFSGRYMNSTTAGWRDDRIFVSVPCGGQGDKFPETIPAYLTECKEWEMKRWFDVGREDVEAA